MIQIMNTANLCCVWGEGPGAILSPTAQRADPEANYEAFGAGDAGEVKEFLIYGGFQRKISILSLLRRNKSHETVEFYHRLPGMGVHDVALAPDNTTFTAVALDGSMYLLDVLDGVKMPSVSHTLAPNFWSTAFGGRSDWLYGGTGDGKVHKYGSEQGALLETYDTRKPSNVMGLDVTKDECFVATGDDNGILTIFDADTKKISLQLDFRKTIRRLCFDPLGRHLLIACEDHTIKIVNMPHGVVEATTPKHAAAVVSVDASPDGKYFVSGSSDGTVKLWDVRFNRCQQTYGSEGALKLWDVAFNPRNDMVACVGKEKKSILHYCNIVES